MVKIWNVEQGTCLNTVNLGIEIFVGALSMH